MKIIKACIVVIILSIPWITNCYAQARPDAHAPIGVMYDHTHPEGSFMLGYRYMISGMNKLVNEAHDEHQVMKHGTEMHGADEHNNDHDEGELENEVPFQGHSHEMLMQMHMLEGMYGLTDDITLMTMVPFQQMEMKHDIGITTRDEGIGDITFSSLIDVYNDQQNQLILTPGISFPTASLTDIDANHGGVLSRHPYHMKLGSGTYDLIPSVTYSGKSEKFGWGSQLGATVRLGENDQGYTFGDRFRLTSWISRLVSSSTSLSFRVLGEHWEDVDGMDEKIIRINDFADPMLQAGTQLLGYLGVNYVVPQTVCALAGHRFSLEIGFPIAQDLDSGQQDFDWSINSAWQYSF